MGTTFKKSDISLIISKVNSNAISCPGENRKLAIPSEESFVHILNEAKSGNEMAVLQIHEWSKYCRASNLREKCICFRIKEAAKKLFN